MKRQTIIKKINESLDEMAYEQVKTVYLFVKTIIKLKRFLDERKSNSR